MTPFFRESKILKCHPAFIISHLIISRETPAPIEMKLHFFSSEIRKQRWNPSRQSCLDLGVVSQAWRHFKKKKNCHRKDEFQQQQQLLMGTKPAIHKRLFPAHEIMIWLVWFYFIYPMSHPSQINCMAQKISHTSWFSSFLVLPSKKNGRCNVKMTELV